MAADARLQPGVVEPDHLAGRRRGDQARAGVVCILGHGLADEDDGHRPAADAPADSVRPPLRGLCGPAVEKMDHDRQ